MKLILINLFRNSLTSKERECGRMKTAKIKLFRKFCPINA
jgi:hypothetical protein